MGNEIESVIGAITSLIIIVFIASAVGQVMQTIGEHDHPQLQSKIDSQAKTIERLREENKRLKRINENVSEKYQELKNQSITKKDITRIQQELNNTNAEVQILNQKFETVNKNFIDAYNKTV